MANISKWIYRICFIVIILFSIVGAMFLYTVFHELSHKQDLEKYVTDEGEMCFFAYPVNATLKQIVFGNYAAGYYMYNYKSNITKEVKNNIDLYTEKKAIIVAIIIPVILMLCIIVEMLRRIRNADAEEFNEFFYKWLDKNYK